MKKLLRIAVVLGLVMCLSVTAFASVGAPGMGGATIDGKPVEVKESPATVEPTAAEAAAAVEAAGVEAKDLTVVWVRDLSVVIPEGSSVTITFDIPEAAADQKVFILHYNGTDWEKVGEGTGKSVTATFTSLSPVAIVLEKTAATPTPGGDKPTSPQTGADMTLMYVGVAVFLAAGAVALVTKKKSA